MHHVEDYDATALLVGTKEFGNLAIYFLMKVFHQCTLNPGSIAGGDAFVFTVFADDTRSKIGSKIFAQKKANVYSNNKGYTVAWDPRNLPQIRTCGTRFEALLAWVRTEHTNLLLIDHDLHEILLFEPHGALEGNYGIDTGYQKAFQTSALLKTYSFHGSADVCPVFTTTGQTVSADALIYLQESFPDINHIRAGLQLIEQLFDDSSDVGFCLVWAIFFLYTRLLNPTKSAFQIYKPLVNGLFKAKAGSYIFTFARRLLGDVMLYARQHGHMEAMSSPDQLRNALDVLSKRG